MMSRTCSAYLGRGFAIMQRGAVLAFRSYVWADAVRCCVFGLWMSRILSMHTCKCRKGAYSAASTWEVENYARQESIGMD